MAQRGLYGRGIYFTTDCCKAMQFCDRGSGCIILAQVVLGLPFMAEGPKTIYERPSEIEGYGGPHDSTIARLGIPNSKGTGKRQGGGLQAHWEFVVQRGDLRA